MVAIDLPDEIEQRLDALAKATGRTKESYLQEAIVEYLGDLEDFTWPNSGLRTFAPVVPGL